MDVNLLCWCDEAANAAPEQHAVQLLQATAIIRELVGKLADLEQHAMQTPNQVCLATEDWQRAMRPLAASEPPSAQSSATIAKKNRLIAEKAFHAALRWHCHHPQATLEAAHVAANQYAQAVSP